MDRYPTQTKEFNHEEFDADFEAFNKAIPGVVTSSAPSQESKKQQLGAFLEDEINNPQFAYPKLEDISTDGMELKRQLFDDLSDQISALGQPHRNVYEQFIRQSMLQSELVLSMKRYAEADDEAEKSQAGEDFMQLNVELYGEPDKKTYHSLLAEKIANISDKPRSPEAEEIFQQLHTLLPEEAFNPSAISDRFKPSEETVQWMNQVVNTLYGNLLSPVPEGEDAIGPSQLRDVFEEIITEEFDEAAEGWRAVMKEGAKAISVGASSKTITVPADRAPVSTAEAKRLVVHEIGIHMMTALTGESTDIAPLGRGLAGYYDTQEGLGKVVEQALEGEFKEAGRDHYITAGLAYFDGKDFRGAFEAKWRMKLLEDLAPGEVPTQEQIDRARRLAADGPLIAATRIFRGTNDLPLFKDLSYYNGSVDVWKYLESIRGDDLQLGLLLAGKISASKEHQRVILESRSVD